MKSLTRVWPRSHNAYQKKKKHRSLLSSIVCPTLSAFSITVLSTPFLTQRDSFQRLALFFLCSTHPASFSCEMLFVMYLSWNILFKRLGSVSYAESRPFSSVEEKWRPSTCSALVLLQKTSAVMIC